MFGVSLPIMGRPKAVKSKQFIIEKTAPIFNIKGVAATGMSDIMEVTKMAKGSMYTHFENKEDLAYQVVDFYLKQHFVNAAAATSKHGKAKDKFFAYLDVLKDPVNHPIEGGCPMLNFGMEADDTNPIIREKVRNAMEEAQLEIVALLRKGVVEGEFVEDWDIEEFAVQVFAMLEGGVLMSRVYGDSSAMRVLLTILKREVEKQLK